MVNQIRWLNTKQKDLDYFEEMIAAIDYDVTRLLMKSQIRQNLQREQVAKGTTARSAGDGEVVKEAKKKPVSADGTKVGRNDPCPCGSGKKYKNCHGQA